MIDGWPIAHHVFPGQLRDSSTVKSVLQDLQERFGLRRVVFVGDRGMVTSDNLDLLRSSGQGYLVGLKRRRQPEILRYLERATGPWLECAAGISTSERSVVPKTLVQEVASDKPGVRVFVVHSDERLDYERGEREKAMQKVQEELEALQQRVEKGKLKAPEKIGAAASRVLSRHHGFRYYAWELRDGQFHYFEHPQNLQQEEALEGKYLIQSEEQNLSPSRRWKSTKISVKSSGPFPGSRMSSKCGPSITRHCRVWKHTSSSLPWRFYWTAPWKRK